MTTAITPESMSEFLTKSACLFPLHEFAHKRPPILIQAWRDALTDVDDAEFKVACVRLFRRLDRYPVPADLLQEVREMRGPEVKS